VVEAVKSTRYVEARAVAVAEDAALGVGPLDGVELQAASVISTTRLMGWRRCNEPMVFRLRRF
jgi:hypothetical protein